MGQELYSTSTTELKPLPVNRVIDRKTGKTEYHLKLGPFMRDMLQERADRIENGPLVLHNKDWWININGCFYQLRNRLERLGYDINQLYPGSEKTFLNVRRKKLIASIKSICDNWYGKGRGIKRSRLGIYADERATFAFNGKTFLVGLDDIEELSILGTDIILVEKPNITKKLAPFTTGIGIALLECGGNFVEYAVDLCEKARDAGCRIFLLTDFDIAGIAMSMRLPYAKVIGLDLNTLRALGIDPDEVDETYEPSENQHTFVYDKLRFFKAAYRDGEVTEVMLSGDYTVNSFDGDFTEYEYDDETNLIHYNIPLLRKLAENEGWWDYLKHRRIELDIFIEHDKLDLQAFWDYLANSMLSYYPKRDYTRAIKDPTALNCKFVSKPLTKLYKMLQPAVDIKLEEIHWDLQEYEGFVNTNEKYEEIKEECNSALKSNPKINQLMMELNEVINKEEYRSLFNE